MHKPTEKIQIKDTRNRSIRDLRISVTDRCNFRCTYCMPKEIFGRDFKFMERNELLTFDEINRLSVIFAECGVNKIRITGGEPLVRKQLEVLVERLAKLDISDLTLTTNGALLKKKAKALKEAGLDRITVSLDSLDDRVFRDMNDVNFPVKKVLEGIEEAQKVGLNPVKVNMVIKRGHNEDTAIEMCRYFKGSGAVLRFIEFMDVGNTNGWQMKHVVPSKEMVSKINASFPIEPIERNYIGEVAERWKYRDGSGEIGFISSVTAAFCSDCTRARLSADGKLYTCLFATTGLDLRHAIRNGATDDELSEMIKKYWNTRSDNYSEIRHMETSTDKKVEMSYIGG